MCSCNTCLESLERSPRDLGASGNSNLNRPLLIAKLAKGRARAGAAFQHALGQSCRERVAYTDVLCQRI